MEQQKQNTAAETATGFHSTLLEEQIQARNTPLMLCLLWLFGSVAAELFLFGGPYGVAVPIVALVFCGTALWYLRKRTGNFRMRGCLWLLPISLLSAFAVFNGSRATNWLTFLVLCGLCAVFLLDASGAVGSPFHKFPFVVAGLTLLVRTACRSLSAPGRAGTARIKQSGRHTGRYIFFGLLAATPVFLVLLLLFVQADQMFGEGVNRILGDMDFTVVIHGVIDGMIGLFLSIYLGTVLMVLRSTRELRPVLKKHQGWIPAPAVSAFMSVLILLELVFCAVQFRYLFGGSALPQGFTYAEYARSGFFAIAAASILTVGIIAAVSVVTRVGKKGLPVAVKVLLTIFSACVGVLFVSAFYRMGLYMDVFGLTVKRVLVCWLMALIGLTLCGVLLKIWKPSVHLTGIVLLTVVCMTVVLNGLRVDALVARENVNRYLKEYQKNPQSAQLDTAYLGSLSADAAPYLVKLLGTPLEQDAKQAMAKLQYEWKNSNWRNWSPGTSQAMRVLKNQDLLYDPYYEAGRRSFAGAETLLPLGAGNIALLRLENGAGILADRENGFVIADNIQRFLEQDGWTFFQAVKEGGTTYYVKISPDGTSYQTLVPDSQETREEAQRLAALFGEVPSNDGGGQTP